MRGHVTAGLTLAAALVLAVPLAAQGADLGGAAERVRAAWARGDVAGVLSGSPRILVQLPGADPSAPIERSQAEAMLRGFVRGAEEVETLVRAARVVGEARGYVELVRRYRVRGTQEVQRQTVLLSYREGPDGWVLTELRIGR